MGRRQEYHMKAVPLCKLAVWLLHTRSTCELPSAGHLLANLDLVKVLGAAECVERGGGNHAMASGQAMNV